jgi:hypothetical protein
MFKRDREKESLTCSICFQDYNLNLLPNCLIPCGHTFCIKCANILKSKKCTICESNISQVIPDYALADIVIFKLTGIPKNDNNYRNNAPRINTAADKPTRHVTINDSITRIEIESTNKNIKTVSNNSKKQNILTDSTVHLIMHGNETDQLKGMYELRKLLSVEVDPPIDSVVDSPGLVDKFIEILRKSTNKELIFETLWVLTNVASGTTSHVAQIMRHSDILTILINFISSDNVNIEEQSIWCLSNIAGDSPLLRDSVLDAGIMEPLLK